MKFFLCTAIFVLFTFIFISSCKSNQKTIQPKEPTIKLVTEQDIQALPKVLEFSKSACRGKCPYFDLTIHQDGYMVFEGKRFTAQEGKATAQLSAQEFAQLQAHCQAADFWKHQPEYGMNIQDIPTTTVHLYEKDRDRTIKWKMRAPEELATLSNQIMELVYAKGWVERNEKSKDRGLNLPAGTVDNELIIQFKEKIKTDDWCEKYERYGLKLKKSLSTTTPIYLMSYNTGEMSPDKMLEMVKMDKQVATAEFNKRMNTRGRN